MGGTRSGACAIIGAVDLIGRQLGNYRIVSCLGVGGMGAVYLAEHLVIGRKAAIKVLHERTGADDETVSQFFDEARAANKVHHRGIVDIYDCGHDEEIGPYLVMEYLEGESLGELLRREGYIAIPEAAHIIVGVADVLQAVHDQGIVHRDLKPDNIFLASDGHIEVLDFGVAQLARVSASDTAPAGRVKGTPHYMSPEQCTGASGVDHRTDIYALGVIVYEMLTGLPPFDNRDPRKILMMHLSEPPPPPSAVNPIIPPSAEHVILRSLAKQPDQRFVSVWELASELARVAGIGTPERTLPAAEANQHAPTPPAKKPRDTLRNPVPPTAAAPVEILRRTCPQCEGRPMQPVGFGDVELDVCPTCRGVWFDRGEEIDMARQSLGEDPRIRELASELGERVRVTSMRCPCCEEPLVCYRFPQHEDLEVEICELCGGLWLEHGEVAHVQRSRAEQLVKQIVPVGDS